MKMQSWWLAVSVLVLALGGGASVAVGQVAGLDAAQQQRLLQQLSPAQRQALLNRFAGQAQAVPGAAADTDPDELATDSMVPVADDAEESDEPPRFAPGDSLVVFVTLPEETPPIPRSRPRWS